MKTNKAYTQLKKFVDVTRFDINQRIDAILNEIEWQNMKWEQDALKAYERDITTTQKNI